MLWENPANKELWCRGQKCVATSVHGKLCMEQSAREPVSKEQSCSEQAGVGNNGSENL